MPEPTLDSLPTPQVVVDRARLDENIRSMQAACTAGGVELRPHIKTHKMLAVARRQLAAGASGLTCAKLGEAEAMLASGAASIFIAHSLVDPGLAPRLAALAERMHEVRLGVTSLGQAELLNRLAARTGRRFPVMMGCDTGLGREGVRSSGEARNLARDLAGRSHLELRGFYTHEGHLYGVPPDELPRRVAELAAKLGQLRDSIDPALPLWPGCSVSARLLAESGSVQAIRPGTYVFGDLSLTRTARVMSPQAAALTILATVVDKPETGLALVDAGSKTFSSDRTADGLSGLSADGRDIAVVRVNEEHGYVRGGHVDELEIGERVAFVPAHVCPVVNLTDSVIVTENGHIVESWQVDARGCTR